MSTATAHSPKGLSAIAGRLNLFLNAMPGMAGNRTLEDKYLNGLVYSLWTAKADKVQF